MSVIDKDFICRVVAQDLRSQGIIVTPEVVRDILDHRDEMITIYSKDQETIKYGTIGKFTIFEGRKHALQTKKALIAEGHTPEEAGRIARERLKETRGTINNKTRKPKKKKDTSNDIEDLPL